MLDKIKIQGAKVHNLKNVSLEFPKNKLVVFTGVSGSGKSSLAFDTLYAEGQRRYVESLSSYARQFLGMMEKPDVEHIEGLSPAISIDQKSTGHNPRSTVGTITEIYDYMRLLFARVGTAYDPETNEKLESQTVQEIVERILEIPSLGKVSREAGRKGLNEESKSSNSSGTKIIVLSPLVKNRKGTYEELFQKLLSQGFTRARVNGNIKNLDEEIKLDRYKTHNIDLVVDRLVLSKEIDSEQRKRITDSVELALSKGDGQLIVSVVTSEDSSNQDIVMSESMVMSDGSSFPKLEPNLFSFNSPIGACPVCNGLGFIMEIDPNLVYNPRLTISEGAIYPWSRSWDMNGGWYRMMLEQVSKKHKIDLKVPMGKLSKEKLNLILYGTGEETYHVTMESGHSFNGKYEGVIPNLTRRYKETQSDYIRDELGEYFRDIECHECKGKRLNKYALSVRIADKNIWEVSNMNIAEALQWVETL